MEPKTSRNLLIQLREELVSEVLAPPECEGDGAGLAKDPEGSQLLMEG